MQWLVCPIAPPPVRLANGNEFEMPRTDYVKTYHTDPDSARRAATAAATANPTVQYGVFVVLDIYETLPPAAPKMLHKRINEQGEVVVA